MVYALIVTVVLTRADVVSPSFISARVVRLATWVVVAYFFLGIGMNLASHSRPERVLMSPVAALLCALCAVVAVS